MYDIIFIGKNNEFSKRAFKKLKNRFPLAKSVFEDDVQQAFNLAQKKIFTKLFWVVWDDLAIAPEFNFDYQVPEWDMSYTHTFLNKDKHNGVVLFPKNKEVSSKELNYRFFINSKEIDIVASVHKKYDIFYIDTYEDYLEAITKSTTVMTWIVPREVTPLSEFKFDLTFDYISGELELNHVFKNGDKFNGIMLLPTSTILSKREIDYRFPVQRKEYDIVASCTSKYDIFYIDTYEDYLEAITKSTTAMTWFVPKEVTPLSEFKFDLTFDYTSGELELNHVFKNDTEFNGIMLLPTATILSEREIKYRFPVQRKEYDIVASRTSKYDIFYIDTYEEYVDAVAKSTTAMTWFVPKEVTPLVTFKFDLRFDHNSGELELNHVFKNGDKFNGIMLLPTATILSEREIKYRFPVQRKEYDIVASEDRKYDIFYIDTYEDYLAALEKSTTAMTWLVPKEVVPLPEFKFDLLFGNCFDTTSGEVELNHVFKNKDRDVIKYNGIMLVSKTSKLSRREIEYRFPIQRKEYDIVATRHRPYDVVFISYNEPNADANWERLSTLVPTAQRVHGIKGIHQAHKTAASLVETTMFFVVDGDAIIEDSFNFELLLPDYDEDTVCVWNSINPINGLTYGYGGVKLLPTELTRTMDVTTTDMTMNISDKFKVMDEVSNITAFNTDPFTTWRSAFRECSKLIITNNEESMSRLAVWSTLKEDVPYGFYAYTGALAGQSYAQKNAADPAALNLINDFTWLQDQFNQQQWN
jgi:hypothetical protein